MRNGARKTRRERRNGAPQIEHGRTYCASLCVRGKKLTDRLFVSYSTTQHPCYLRSSDNCHDPVTGLGGWDHLEPKSVQDQVRHGWHATVHRKQNNNNIAVLRSTCSSQTTSAPRYTHFDEILLIDGRFPFICSQPAVALKGGHNCAGKKPTKFHGGGPSIPASQGQWKSKSIRRQRSSDGPNPPPPIASLNELKTRSNPIKEGGIVGTQKKKNKTKLSFDWPAKPRENASTVARVGR